MPPMQADAAGRCRQAAQHRAQARLGVDQKLPLATTWSPSLRPATTSSVSPKSAPSWISRGSKRPSSRTIATARVPVRITASAGTTSARRAGPGDLQTQQHAGVSAGLVVELEARLQRARRRVHLRQDLRSVPAKLRPIGLQRGRHLLAA